MIEDILNESVPKIDWGKDIPADNVSVEVASDKELLEDFLNGLESEGSDLKEIQDLEPEMRLDKYLWVIRQKEKELQRCKALAEESINRTQSWFDKKANTISSAIEFLSGQMRNYLKQNQLKTLSLPNGKIGIRKQPDTIEITDETLFLTTAGSELLKYVPEKFEADLKSIKDHIKKTSEIPAGVELKAKEDKFYYKLSEL